MDKFKSFLINENKSYLGHRVGDVLTAVHDLTDDLENLGARHLTRLAEEIVNRIRKILHGQWEARNHKYLQELQKVAVAIQKTIDEKGDLREILPAAQQSLEDLSGKLGIKINSLQAPPERAGGEDVSQQDFQLTGQGPSQQNQGQPPQQPPQGQFPPQQPPIPPPQS